MEEIKGISDYIQQITKILSKRNSNKDKIVVYRGEPQKYEIPGKPGIFRESHIEKEAFFEKNLLNEMKGNRITSGNTYLECAVDAQHDEFPSRLLDVTYNALVALYFAVTPYYKRYSEDAFDEKYDAQVIVYFLPHMYCAGAENLEDIFNKTIKREDEYLSHALVQENYKLIDHIKMNTRICVQQGAFIMFQGDEYTPISKKDFEVIEIKKENRKRLREELDMFFGINTGFIYPEPFNLFSTMGNKAYRIVNTEINEITELNSFVQRVEGELEFYFERALKVDSDSKLSFNQKKRKIVSLVMEIEELLFKYKIELCDYLEKYFVEKENVINEYSIKFDKMIQSYDSLFCLFERKYGITRSCEELKCKLDVMESEVNE